MTTDRPAPAVAHRVPLFAVVLGVVSVLVAVWWVAGALLGNDTKVETVVINGIETSTPDAAHQPPLDLDPGAQCTVDLDGLRATGRITNHTDRPWGYRIKVAWEDNGTTRAEATALLEPIAPSASAPFTLVSASTGTAATTCRVVAIDRRAP